MIFLKGTGGPGLTGPSVPGGVVWGVRPGGETVRPKTAAQGSVGEIQWSSGFVTINVGCSLSKRFSFIVLLILFVGPIKTDDNCKVNMKYFCFSLSVFIIDSIKPHAF